MTCLGNLGELLSTTQPYGTEDTMQMVWMNSSIFALLLTECHSLNNRNIKFCGSKYSVNFINQYFVQKYCPVYIYLFCISAVTSARAVGIFLKIQMHQDD